MKPIFKPYMPQNIEKGLIDLLYSGMLSYGKYGKLFEESIGDLLNTSLVLTTSTYNHAMLVAIATLGLQPGDEVLCSPVSCLASNQPFVTQSLKVKWVDIDPNTSNICLADLKRKVSNKTKLIVINHFCGYPCDMKAVSEIGSKFNIPIVQDCIEAFGSKLNGNYIDSSHSDIVIYSFQTVRLPNTVDGGCMVFKSDSLYKKAIKIRDYGIDRSIFRDSNGEISPNCDIHTVGYGATMNELSSFIGLSQIPDVEFLLNKQKENALKWNKEILQIDGIKPLGIHEDSTPNYWVYGVLCEDKERAIRDFRNSGWYATSVHLNNNVYSIFGKQDDLSGVTEFMERFLAIPCGWWIDK